MLVPAMGSPTDNDARRSGRKGPLRLLARTLSKAWQGNIFSEAAEAAFWQTVSFPPLLLGAVIAYETGAADTATEVFKAIAAAVNVNASADYSAIAIGRKLFVVNRAGTAFSLENAAAGAVTGSGCGSAARHGSRNNGPLRSGVPSGRLRSR